MAISEKRCKFADGTEAAEWPKETECTSRIVETIGKITLYRFDANEKVLVEQEDENGEEKS